ncbi:MAG: ycgJ 3 [Gemmatimonadetes bacterium]|nr:ycgJ 3 [Gemmatimonadota bacterium]
MPPGTFRDHFSAQAGGYATFRPTYPASLFTAIVALAPARRLAWDCATGNGQAAGALAPHFERVIATDASIAQVEAATPYPNVEYRVATAEQSGLEDSSVDFITVAQALHWFDLPAFGREARRVMAPGGVLAIWGYLLAEITPEVDQLVLELHNDIVGEYWPAGRDALLNRYEGLELPFEELPSPPAQMEHHWELAQLMGYLGTWSAVAAYRKQRGSDPLALVRERFERAWGNPSQLRAVRWPLHLHLYRKRTD